jgi:cytochrome c nitrite reductase small subunit
MKNLYHRILPPADWRLPVVVLLGVFFGLGFYAFYISKAWSYLGDDPKSCINCHVMNPQYANWAHNSHYRVTTCNDCHVPHTSVISKYYFKAMDGLNHATMFTLRLEPQVIIMEEETRPMVQQNCIRCHEKSLGMDYVTRVIPTWHNYLEERYCLDCHRETPHSRVNGLAATPNALNIQHTASRVPEWLEKELGK